MKKKTLSLALALVMCLGLTVPAFAANPVTLTDGGLSVTLSDVLFEEDVTIHFNDYGEEYDETIHIYRTPETEKYVVTATNNGAPIQNYDYGYNAWPLTLKDGIWTAVDGAGINDGTDGSDGEVWASGASWDILENIQMALSYDPDALYYTSVRVKDGDREEIIGFFCVGGDQPMATVKPDQPDDTQPTTPPAAEPATASPTNDALTADGVLQTPTVYKINGSNYFKIRDLAAILNGTSKQFSVGYDAELKSVTATTGEGYEKQEGDLAGAPAGGDKTAEPSNDAIYINGEKVEAEVYKIDGSNYFKLRDLGKALDFYVGYSQETGVFLETGKPYSE